MSIRFACDAIKDCRLGCFDFCNLLLVQRHRTDGKYYLRQKGIALLI